MTYDGEACCDTTSSSIASVLVRHGLKEKAGLAMAQDGVDISLYHAKSMLKQVSI